MECLELALQAPTGSNAQGWQWVFVDDPEKKKALADIYRHQRDAVPRPAQARVRRRTRRAAAPRVRARRSTSTSIFTRRQCMLIPCLEGRPDGAPAGMSASFWGSLLPAVWSFMLALRSRGLGSAWTTLHLHRRRRKAGRRTPRHSVRQVQPGRLVPDRLHQGHRLPACQAAARRAGHALERLVNLFAPSAHRTLGHTAPPNPCWRQAS